MEMNLGALRCTLQPVREGTHILVGLLPGIPSSWLGVALLFRLRFEIHIISRRDNT